jgi:branched-chain amino acid transport system substrate-binding protein
MNRKHIAVGLVSSIILFVSIAYFHGHYSSYDYSLRQRADIADQNNADIHIAVVWDLLGDTSFLDGVRLAAKEANAQGITLKAGHKAGHKVTQARLVLHDFDDSTDDTARDSRLSIAADRHIVAVVGHSSSSTAIPASITYEYNGILFISTVATDPALTAHNFKYTFSIIPSDKYFVAKLIEYAKQQRLFKLAILYARDDYGIKFYQEFVGQLDEAFEIVTSRSFYPTPEDIAAGNLNSKTDEVIFPIMENGFDAVVLCARDKLGSQMIEALRVMGVTQPILGGDGLEGQTLWNLPPQSSDNTYFASIFKETDKDSKNMLQDPVLSNFIRNFKAMYGYAPGYFAFQGYQAIKVLAAAYQLTGSTVPIRVGSTLRYHFQKGYDNYAFDVNGMVTNRAVFIKKVQDGHLQLHGREIEQ